MIIARWSTDARFGRTQWSKNLEPHIASGTPRQEIYRVPADTA